MGMLRPESGLWLNGTAEWEESLEVLERGGGGVDGGNGGDECVLLWDKDETADIAGYCP